jgi:hypothetical protein
MILRDSDPRMTALGRASCLCKLQTRSLTVINPVMCPRRVLTPRQTGRLTVGLNIMLTFDLLSPRVKRPVHEGNHSSATTDVNKTLLGLHGVALN